MAAEDLMRYSQLVFEVDEVYVGLRRADNPREP